MKKKIKCQQFNTLKLFRQPIKLCNKKINLKFKSGFIFMSKKSLIKANFIQK